MGHGGGGGERKKAGVQQKIKVFYPVKRRSNKNTPCSQSICADLQIQTSQKKFRELQQKSNQTENKDEELRVPHMAEGRLDCDRSTPATSSGMPSSERENYIILSAGVYHDHQI